MSSPSESPLVRLLSRTTAALVRRPWVAILAAAGLAVACVLTAVSGLKFKTSRLDLLNPRSAFNQRWTAYLEEFGDADDAVLIASGPPPRVTLALQLMTDILSEAALPPGDVLGRPDFSRIEAAALHLAPAAELARPPWRRSWRVVKPVAQRRQWDSRPVDSAADRSDGAIDHFSDFVVF